MWGNLSYIVCTLILIICNHSLADIHTRKAGLKLQSAIKALCCGATFLRYSNESKLLNRCPHASRPLQIFFTKMYPLGWYQVHFFEFVFGNFRGAGKGRGCASVTVPLQNPNVTFGLVPSTFLRIFLWQFQGGWEGERVCPWHSTCGKPKCHFTEGMFEKR